MVQFTNLFEFKEPKSGNEKKYNCIRCCLSDVGCDQLFDLDHHVEPCISLYLLIHKTTLEEALKHTGYLIFKK